MPRRKMVKLTNRFSQRTVRCDVVLVSSVAPEGCGWRITLVDLSSEWLGVKHTVAIPEEVPIQGAVAALFEACGIEIGSGHEVDPREVEGKTVRAVLYTSASGESQIIGFEPCQETQHEPDA